MPRSPRLLAWQAWRLVTSTFIHFAWQAWHLVTSTVTLRGGRGAYGTGLALVLRLGLRLAPLSPRPVGMAGVALGDIDLHFAWQAWHLVTSTFTLRGRRGTYGAELALLPHLGLRLAPLSLRLFAWQAWHLVTSTFTLRVRRGAW